jgi:hypothetical protein
MSDQDPGANRSGRAAFGTAREGATLQIPPPFRFQGVNCRVFPLRANMAQLTRFCEAFVNRGVPRDLVYFRPAMPIVFVQLIHYGRMAVQTDNYGWFSQRELVFSVPVERYRVRDGSLEFQEWGLLNPFIFVDETASEIIGREVYGWNKVSGWLRAETSPWLDDPRADRRLAIFDTMAYGTVFDGRALEPVDLIEVCEKAPASWSEVPPDLRGGYSPLHVIPQAAIRSFELLATAWQNLANLATSSAITWIDNFPAKGIRPLTDTRLDLDKLASLIPLVLPVNERNHYSLFTLKQFRDAEDPRYACYQSVMSSQMYLDRFNAGGMLGDGHLARLDTTGGYYLRIHEYPSQPIVPSLGLVPSARSVDGNGIPVSTFEPVLPFWVDVDISYDRGDTICSQVPWSTWEPGNRPEYAPPPDGAVHRPAAGARPMSASELEDSHLYNTARGEALQEMVGPFRFPDASLHVLPLLACRETLQRFVSAAYDAADQRFEVAGDRVYLIVTDFDRMDTPANDIGRWAHREVRFAVPVRWFDHSGPRPRFVSMALVSPFVYCDRDTAMDTLREVYGEAAFEATIRGPRSPWLEQGGAAPGTPLAEVITGVLPALDVGARMQRRRLLSIRSGGPDAELDDGAWARIASAWGPRLLEDLQRKQARAAEHPEALETGRALALALLTDREGFNQITLKEFRDAHDIDTACYRALVNTETRIEHVSDLQEIEAPVHVAIDEYPTQPIVRLLGLVTKWQDTSGPTPRAHLQALRPFRMRASLLTGAAENVAVSAGRPVWRPGRGWPGDGYFDRTAPCAVGRGAVRALEASVAEARTPAPDAGLVERDALTAGGAPGGPDGAAHDMPEAQGHHRFLDRTLERWLAGATPEERVDRDEARRLLADESCLDPQMVLDSILSREWGHRGRSRAFRRLVLGEPVSQLPDFCVRRDSAGPAGATLMPAEQSMEITSGGWFPALSEDTP